MERRHERLEHHLCGSAHQHVQSGEDGERPAATGTSVMSAGNKNVGVTIILRHIRYVSVVWLCGRFQEKFGKKDFSEGIHILTISIQENRPQTTVLKDQ